jgi:hypothetical protein
MTANNRKDEREEALYCEGKGDLELLSIPCAARPSRGNTHTDAHMGCKV